MNIDINFEQQISRRSRLFSINPEGINTYEVESLISYMSRLAFYHGVTLGELLDLEIARELKKEYLHDLIKYRKTVYSKYILGSPEVSLDFVEAIEKLTCQKNIINLTFLNWRGLINKGINQDKRFWCSLCLEESKIYGYETYEKLIWLLRIIDYCPKHFIKLESRCPHCNKTNPLILSQMRAGFCSKCQKWLGSDISTPSLLNDWELWKVNNTKYLMDYFQNATYIPTKYIIGDILKKLVKQYTKGNKTAFARIFGIRIPSVSDWINNRYTMPFHRLLKFSCYFNISIVDLLEQKEYKLNDINKSAISLFVKKNGNNKLDFDPVKLRYELKEILLSKEEPPPSMIEVISRLGYSRSRLYRHGNELCKKISEKRKNYISKKKIEHEETIYNEIYRVVKEIIEEGQYPTETNIRKKLSFPMFYTKMNFALEKVFKELQIENKKVKDDNL